MFFPFFSLAVISIHAPMRGRPNVILPVFDTFRFQSTPPCGGNAARISRPRRSMNFNPRPHAGATPAKKEGEDHGKISIHAPMRGRPLASGSSGLPGWISIHAPMRGRRKAEGYKSRPGSISIHAPMRGRPLRTGLAGILVSTFQSTPPCGGDCPRYHQNDR